MSYPSLWKLCNIFIVGHNWQVGMGDNIKNNIDKRCWIYILPFLLRHDIVLQIFSIQYYFNASFSFHKLIPKNDQMTTLYTNLLLCITFTKIYYIRQE